MSKIFNADIKAGEKAEFPSGKFVIANYSDIEFIDVIGGVNSTVYFKLGPNSSVMLEDMNGITLSNDTKHDIHVAVDHDGRGEMPKCGLSGKTFCLDAGHGGKDPGAVNGSHYEKDTALKIVMKLKNLIETFGAKVILTRDDDSYPGLTSRANIANHSRSDCFISVHLNSAENKTATGYEVLVYKKKGNSENIAKKVLKQLGTVVAWPNRGIKERPDLTVLSKTSMPAILVEVGFISNDKESEELMKDTTQLALAKAIFNGMVEYYGTQNKGTTA